MANLKRLGDAIEDAKAAIAEIESSVHDVAAETGSTFPVPPLAAVPPVTAATVRPDGGPLLPIVRPFANVTDAEGESYQSVLVPALDANTPADAAKSYSPSKVGLKRHLSLVAEPPPGSDPAFVYAGAIDRAISEVKAFGGRRETYAEEFGDKDGEQLVAYYSQGVPYGTAAPAPFNPDFVPKDCGEGFQWDAVQKKCVEIPGFFTNAGTLLPPKKQK